MSTAITGISANTAQSLQLQQVQLQGVRHSAAVAATTANQEAGVVASATVAIQQNQNTARVGTQLQQQLTATQANNLTPLVGQGRTQVANTTATATTTAPPVAATATTATVVPKQANQIAAQTRATQQVEAKTTAQAQQQATQQSQAQQQQKTLQAAQQAQQETLKTETARAPTQQPASSVQQYQATQSLLQPTGTNTHQVSTVA